MSRSAVFAFTGIQSTIFWVVANPTSEVTAVQGTWPYVLWFSATLLGLSIAVFLFGRMLGGGAAERWAILASAAVFVASVANVIEDGFRVEEAFLLFILSSVIFDVALIALTIAIVVTAPDRYRLLAVVPAGSLMSVLFFITAGGPILLVTWLIAAAAALRPFSPREVPAATS